MTETKPQELVGRALEMAASRWERTHPRAAAAFRAAEMEASELPEDEANAILVSLDSGNDGVFWHPTSVEGKSPQEVFSLLVEGENLAAEFGVENDDDA